MQKNEQHHINFSLGWCSTGNYHLILHPVACWKGPTMTEDHRQPSEEEEEEEEKMAETKYEMPVGVIIIEMTSSPTTTTSSATPAAAAAAACEQTVLSISTRACLDVYRWQNGQMPSLEKFTKLQHLELDKDRYLHHLNESVTRLQDLQCLLLTRCSRLQSLPQAIGLLGKLQVVCIFIYIYLVWQIFVGLVLTLLLVSFII